LLTDRPRDERYIAPSPAGFFSLSRLAMSAFLHLKNGRVLGPESRSAEPWAEVDLLIAHGRIAAIGKDLGPLGVTCETLDLEGRHVIPGLVDAHVHLTGGGGEAGFKTRVPRVEVSALSGNGVTSVVGVLGTDGATRTLRDLVASAYAVREEGLSAWCYTGNYAVPVMTLTGSVKDDLVFVEPIVGVGELAISDHRYSQPTLDELLRIASDAYVAGLTAGKSGVMHLHLGDGERGLELVRRALATAEIPARVWHPTHLNRNRRLWAEAKDLARVARPPYFDVTAFPHDDDPDTLSAVEAVLDWVGSGLPADRLTVSSDGGGCLPSFDHDGRMVAMGVGSCSTLLETLRGLVDAGLPLAEAVPFFTRQPAQVLGLRGGVAGEAGPKGVIALGSDADLVVLDGDLRLCHVFARGRAFVRDGGIVRGGTFEGVPSRATEQDAGCERRGR